MSDLEQQRRALPQEWPERSVSGGGQIPNLTPAQREQAQFADLFAEEVLKLLSKGKNWFTAYEVREKPEGSLLLNLEKVGVITKHKSTQHDGHYYKLCPIARVFALTALALRDERRRTMQERTGGG
jgi:hypothetical protein